MCENTTDLTQCAENPITQEDQEMIQPLFVTKCKVTYDDNGTATAALDMTYSNHEFKSETTSYEIVIPELICRVLQKEPVEGASAMCFGSNIGIELRTNHTRLIIEYNTLTKEIVQYDYL